MAQHISEPTERVALRIAMSSATPFERKKRLMDLHHAGFIPASLLKKIMANDVLEENYDAKY